MRWIRLENSNINPLNYQTVIANREGYGLINAISKSVNELSLAISPMFGNVINATKDDIISLYQINTITLMMKLKHGLVEALHLNGCKNC